VIAFLEIGAFPVLESATHQKKCELFWQFGPGKLRIPGRLVAPQNIKQPAPTWADKLA
jgi:hypothetical protein